MFQRPTSSSGAGNNRTSLSCWRKFAKGAFFLLVVGSIERFALLGTVVVLHLLLALYISIAQHLSYKVSVRVQSATATDAITFLHPFCVLRKDCLLRGETRTRSIVAVRPHSSRQKCRAGLTQSVNGSSPSTTTSWLEHLGWPQTLPLSFFLCVK